MKNIPTSRWIEIGTLVFLFVVLPVLLALPARAKPASDPGQAASFNPIPVLIKNINTSGNASPRYFTSMNGDVFFIAVDATHGEELWKTSGTETMTELVRDITADGEPSPMNLTVMNGELFFRATDASHRRGLWKTNGTFSGTAMVRDFIADYGDLNAVLVPVSNTLYFAANDGSNSGLWKSDGTLTGTELVKGFGFDYDYNHLYILAEMDGTLYFSYDLLGPERGLWKSDGTYTGTVLVRNFESAPHSSTLVKGTLFFASGGLWKSDGTYTGTVAVNAVSAITISNPSHLTEVNDQLFFIAYDPSYRWGLWKSDGTPTGTVLLRGDFLGGAGTEPKHLTNVSGTLFFQAGISDYGRELWKSDGTPEGTVMVRDIRTTPDRFIPGSSYPSNLTAANGKLFFAADDGVHGNELWTSDGTPEGTVMVADVYPGAIGSDPESLAYVNGILYFAATDVILGKELWKLWYPSSQTYLPVIFR